jgi:methionine sulfoxide reductase heme-binding subunit
LSRTAGGLTRKSRRLSTRLLKHHLPLFGISLACAVSLYARPYPDVLSRLSFATAYPALALLTASLLVGPWTLLRKRRIAVSNDLRRALGIWAGVLGVIHAAVGQCVHLRGRPWLYYIYGPTEHHHSIPLRHDLFGLANYTGGASTLLLMALFATSNDLSLRALGAGRWKQLQRWNYVVFALAAIHSVGYLTIEKQQLSFVSVVAICIGIAIVLQAIGFAKWRADGVIRTTI